MKFETILILTAVVMSQSFISLFKLINKKQTNRPFSAILMVWIFHD